MNVLQPGFWENPVVAIANAYKKTDKAILEECSEMGGSTAVTVILISGNRLLVANVGDSRAVLNRNGVAVQLSIDHEPTSEIDTINKKGGFVTRFPGRFFFCFTCFFYYDRSF